MAVGGDQRHGLISMRDLLDQVDTNKKHFMRTSQSLPELSSPIGSASPRTGLLLATSLPPLRELDNDPDTFQFLCLPIPVFSLHGLQRRIWRCISNLLWTRPPLPCVTTTCGPIHHIRSCEFHPLSDSGTPPYIMPIRRSTSPPSVTVQSSTPRAGNLRSSSSLPENSSPSTSSNSPASSSASSSASPPAS